MNIKQEPGRILLNNGLSLKQERQSPTEEKHFRLPPTDVHIKARMAALSALPSTATVEGAGGSRSYTKSTSSASSASTEVQMSINSATQLISESVPVSSSPTVTTSPTMSSSTLHVPSTEVTPSMGTVASLQKRVLCKAVRPLRSNVESQAPGGVIWPVYQHVWRPAPWTNFSTLENSSSQSKKRKNPESEIDEQQPAKTTKHTSECRSGTTAETSEKDINMGHAGGGITSNSIPMLDIHTNNKRKFSIKIRLPVKEYPWVNFAGKMIGVKGNIIKQLQEKTRCKLTVRGKGLRNFKTAQYEYSQEDQHVLVECFTTTTDAYGRFARAISLLQAYFKPDSDLNALLQSMSYQPNPPAEYFGFREWQSCQNNNSRW